MALSSVLSSCTRSIFVELHSEPCDKLSTPNPTTPPLTLPHPKPRTPSSSPLPAQPPPLPRPPRSAAHLRQVVNLIACGAEEPRWAGRDVLHVALALATLAQRLACATAGGGRVMTGQAGRQGQGGGRGHVVGQGGGGGLDVAHEAYLHRGAVGGGRGSEGPNPLKPESPEA